MFTRETINQVEVITDPTKSRYMNQVQCVIEKKRVVYACREARQEEEGRGEKEERKQGGAS